ncbi:MAG: hypothetical protein ACTHKG_19545 [Nocardioides sp.]
MAGRRRRGAWWLACSLLVLPAGCSGASSRPDPSPADAASSLAVSVSQSRFDEGTRRLRAAVTNTGDRSVHVEAAGIAWSGFLPRPAPIPDGDLGPGQTAGLVLEYGEPRCDGPATDRPALGVVVDGAEQDVPLERDDARALARLHVRACAQQRLERSVSVSLRLRHEPVTKAGEEYLPGAVVVRRLPGSTDELSILDVAGSVLLELAPRDGRSALPARLAAAHDVLRLPVLIGSVHRCDAHALGQSSQTFLLSIYVRLQGQPAQRVTAIPDQATKEVLTGILDRDCGVGE